MIVKELDPFTEREGDTFGRAGRQAEEQMAFYLRRAFGEKKDIHVLNGLRLERGDGDAAQIDHLIVHKAGMIIVESKSVHGSVRVNEHGEWTRVFGSRAQGMPSPIEQARRQAVFLKRFLDDHAPELAGKMLGLIQAHFGALSIDVVVAISDTGIIDRPKKFPLPEVCKADQALAKVEEILARQRRDTSVWTGPLSLKAGRELTRSEITNILALLPAKHSPRGVVAPAPVIETIPSISVEEQLEKQPPVAAEPSPVLEEATCASCGKPLSPKVTQFCRDNAERFGGRLLCFDHQRTGRARGARGATGTQTAGSSPQP